MAIAHVATTTSANPNTTDNTTLTVTRAGTTAGQLEVIEISGLAVGTTVNPTMSTPAGWTKVGERLDTNGTPAAFVAVYYRVRQSGDGSTVVFTWSNAGQMVAVASAYSGVDTTTPIDDEVFWFKVDSNTAYSVSITTTGAGWVRYGFANRTGTAWSGMTDTERGQVTLASSSTMVARDTNGDVAAAAYTKNATGSNTSVGVGWAYRLIEGAAPARSTLHAEATGTSSAPAFTVPAGAATGDVFTVALTLNNSDVITGTPSGLVERDTFASGSSASGRVYTMVVDGTTVVAGQSKTWTLSASRQWQVTAVGEVGAVDTTDPFLDVDVTYTVGTSTALPSLANLAADGYIHAHVHAKSDGVAITGFGAAPAGWTKTADSASGATYGFAASAGHTTGQVDSGSTLAGTWGAPNQTPGAVMAAVIAVRAGTPTAPAPTMKLALGGTQLGAVRVGTGTPLRAYAGTKLVFGEGQDGNNTDPNPAGFTLHLEDQFATLDSNTWAVYGDGEAGTDVNSATFGHQANNPRIQYYRPGNIEVGATGSLANASAGATGGTSMRLYSKREARNGYEFTAGMVDSKNAGYYAPLYSRHECRMKIPHGHGIWPAYWLTCRTGGAGTYEVDMMEYFIAQIPGKTLWTLHGIDNNGTFRGNYTKNFGGTFFEAPTYTPGWHTITTEILPENGVNANSGVRFKGYLDDVLVWNYLDTQALLWTAQGGPADAFWNIYIQGSQIGGKWIGHPDDPLGYSRWRNAPSAGGGCINGGTAPNSCTYTVGGYSCPSPVFSHPASTYEIDYVKVWEFTG